MLSTSDHVIVIAEIGSNHDGDFSKAMRLIDIAADCGADIAKFQSFLANEIVATDHADYELLKRLEIPKFWYPKLIARCHARGIRFLSTATNMTTLDWLEEFEVWGYKVASCNANYSELIDRLVSIGKPLIVSTGLASLDEITSLDRTFQNKAIESAFLHCISQYPCPPENLRLGNIPVLRSLLNAEVGFSDHSDGTEMVVASVALGARVIEKHLSDSATGLSPDHKVSILPQDFSRMVKAIRNTENALETNFSPDLSAMKNMLRSFHYASDLPAGHRIASSDIKLVRPYDGLPASKEREIVGKKLRCAKNMDDPVEWTHIEA